MRKRFMNLSKRCMVAIMSASFIMSSVTVSMAFPVGVYAEGYTYETSDQIVPAEEDGKRTLYDGQTLKEVVENYDVFYSYGVIDENNGDVGGNYNQINTNNNRVANNEATIVNNFGEVNNHPNELDNSLKGTIINQYAGTVDGNGTITNFFNGTIRDGSTIAVTNNYSDQNIAATKNYSAVNFIDPEGGTVEYSGSFTTAKPDGATDVHYVNVTDNNGSGTITIKPDKSGYEVTREAGDVENATKTGEGNSYTFNYSLKKSGNNYILNISNYSGKSSNLNAEMFALAIQAIKLPLRPTGAVVQNIDGSVSVGYTDADTAATAPTGIASLVPVKESYIGGRATTIFAPTFKQDLATLQALPGAGKVDPVYYEKKIANSPAAAAALQGAAVAAGLTILGDRMMTGYAINGVADLTAIVDMPLPARAAGREVFLVVCFPGGATLTIENAPDAPAGTFRCNNFPLRFCSYTFAVI